MKRKTTKKNVVSAVDKKLLDDLFKLPAIYTNNVYFSSTADGLFRLGFAETCEGNRIEHRGTFIMTTMQLESMFNGIAAILGKKK